MQADSLLEQAESKALLAPSAAGLEPEDKEDHQGLLRLRQRLLAAVLLAAVVCCWSLAPAGGPCRHDPGVGRAAPGCGLLRAGAPPPPAPLRAAAEISEVAPAPGKATAPAAAQEQHAAGACSEADHAAWLRGGRESFDGDMDQCAVECWGGDSCLARCIQKKGYSGRCARCFGDLCGCSHAHCFWQCIADHKGRACRSCGIGNCRPAFVNCSGLIPLAASHSYQ